MPHRIEWLRSSYLAEAARWMRVQRELHAPVWGRDINHVALLHLGSFSPHILPDLFALLEREGFASSRSNRHRAIRSTNRIRMSPMPRGGTLTELMMQAKAFSWPEGLSRQASARSSRKSASKWGQLPVS